MVKIAIAGGSGNVAQEIIDVLVATKKHEILLLSRQDVPVQESMPHVTWVKTNYEDPQQLAETLQGVHTVLSFIVVHQDSGNVSQKNLIDAAVQAGVKRFAPSEWASSSLEHLGVYAGKGVIREYLKKLNADKKVLEYSLFQPGLFVNYFTYPYKSMKHVAPLETPFDFNNRRALTADGGHNDRVTFTTVQDLANVVARAVEYDGEWPVIGGIKGTELTIGQLIALGEKVRGGPFAVDKLKPDDLKAGELNSSWRPTAGHPSFPPEEAYAIVTMTVTGILLGISAGSWNVSDEWNQLLPDYRFTQAEEFLTEAWRDKP